MTRTLILLSTLAAGKMSIYSVLCCARSLRCLGTVPYCIVSIIPPRVCRIHSLFLFPACEKSYVWLGRIGFRNNYKC
ncbi:hypothetical protein HOY80DRAFT_969493 [Tuber brumale]|nr:hypothetical protein HOY80DRAFT_969493 [Tuber brumale]